MTTYTKKVYLDHTHVAAEIYRNGREISWKWFHGIWFCNSPEAIEDQFKLANKWADNMIKVCTAGERIPT